DSLEPFFQKNAWKQVCSLLKAKEEYATCKVCERICLEKCIECESCKNWYNLNCANVSNSGNKITRVGKVNHGFVVNMDMSVTLSFNFDNKFNSSSLSV
ncbi:unnamed protein product, partial [Brachionus calyciflorus]